MRKFNDERRKLLILPEMQNLNWWLQRIKVYFPEYNCLKKMYEVINPKIEVVGFGPYRELPNGQITPDEFVYGASGITYKGMRALDELMEAKEKDTDVR